MTPTPTYRCSVQIPKCGDPARVYKWADLPGTTKAGRVRLEPGPERPRTVSEKIFGHHPWTVQGLVSGIKSGQIRLPDIQRPFVWANSKVRDLIDSMYRGFPVGELMFWENADQDHSTTIGLDPKSQSGTWQVIDGQQRLTSLFALVTGERVLREDYSQETIVIAFNPLTRGFDVPNAKTKNAEWIDDIRTVFADAITARTTYIERLEKARGEDRLSRELEREIELSINQLAGVLGYEFQVVQLSKLVTRETVADIFVRINSEGVKLNSSDFILTWLSVFWEEGRQQLEDFARASRFTVGELSNQIGHRVAWSPHNPYLTLDTNQVLRVVVAVGNRRAKLQDAYNALRGRDPRSRQIIPENREKELNKLRVGQAKVLQPNNWDEYLKVLERAGIRNRSMITSKNTVLYGYALWLLGRTEFSVPVDELREVMARWYFMAQLTGRYSSSPETRGQEDLNRLEGLPLTAEAFAREITTQVETALTEDWWSVTLPEALHTSNTEGPAFVGYLSALTILDADVLLSTMKVKDWINPARRSVKGVEKHHLFPKDYLKSVLHYTSTRQINQVANQTLVEWSDNVDISNEAPADYWPKQVADKALQGERLERQQWWHALPDDWTSMRYQDFLEARRRQMALVVREAFKKLSDPNYQPALSVVTEQREAPLPTFQSLVLSAALPAGTYLVPAHGETDSIAEVTEDGTILLDDVEYRTPDQAAQADVEAEVDGWTYWQAELDEPVLLAELRG